MTNLSVQSSVSLQHLPYDTALESKNLESSLLERLSFAKQKLGEIVAAAKAAESGADAGTVTKPSAWPTAEVSYPSPVIN